MATKEGKPLEGDVESGACHPPQPDGSDGSDCFSDAEDQSWHSAYHSRRTGSSFDDLRLSNASTSDHQVSGALEPCRGSNCSSEIDLEDGGAADSETKIAKVDKDCRICHLSLSGSVQESGIAIELGCSCKDDLAAAHRQCAETWFKIKGNSAATPPAFPTEARRSFWHGHRLLNFLLACMVLALFISWLFHFNVPG
ncbi:unnamed protein product [Spirodela intermedia]|uniref:RING-CH-type domain-containing protein n=1 Tax=Spirodela intermedia TaxID=51605 RepID=A0A7I8IE03_SPIIN|nr:unnamed protein product [Spirodela intermedia]CAA6655071.1 unnamed protein product [Spirodela intermedia]